MSHSFSFTDLGALRLLACLALVASSMTEAATLTWSGAGANDNWSTTANWGGAAPVGGDVLTFGGMTRLSPVNDLAAGTEIGGVLLPNNYAAGATAAFSISGASFVLGGNIASSGKVRHGVFLSLADEGPLSLMQGVEPELDKFEVAHPVSGAQKPSNFAIGAFHLPAGNSGLVVAQDPFCMSK
jgi:hypothetical protein